MHVACEALVPKMFLSTMLSQKTDVSLTSNGRNKAIVLSSQNLMRTLIRTLRTMKILNSNQNVTLHMNRRVSYHPPPHPKQNSTPQSNANPIPNHTGNAKPQLQSNAKPHFT